MSFLGETQNDPYTFGPMVTLTASASSLTPSNIAARAEVPKLISLAT